MVSNSPTLMLTGLIQEFDHLNASDNTESKSQGELICILPASMLISISMGELIQHSDLLFR